MCGHIDQVPRITCVLLLASIWCTGTSATDHQDGCKRKNDINETEICIKSCHDRMFTAVSLILSLNSINSKVIANYVTVTASDPAVLKVVTRDNIYWSVFVNDELRSNESVPTEGYRFDGWIVRSSGEFKVLDEECNSLTTLSDTTVTRTTTGEIISYKPNY